MFVIFEMQAMTAMVVVLVVCVLLLVSGIIYCHHFKLWFLLENTLKKGVFTNIIPPPAVSPNKSLIRTAISARHSKEDLEKIGEAMKFAAKGL